MILIQLTLVFDSTFFIELSLEIAVLGVKKFFSQIFLALDFFVVTISLIFELVFYSFKSQLQKVFAILVIFRLWRFVRIGHVRFLLSMEGQRDLDVNGTNCLLRSRLRKTLFLTDVTICCLFYRD